ncbi:FAD-dependent oxidoreductase [Candidatus Roizmanbacteria bacterium]|nr:FAD-dependent oxidoreductase [Candidatus Roizmanbacteria bacterium]
MNIAILGGGFTGLTAAYQLSKKGHTVTIIEKETGLGGLAEGFYDPAWKWPLERAYHHLFANDDDILSFARKIGFKDIIIKSPETASLYKANNQSKSVKTIYRNFPVDTPQDFLKFPLLTFPSKIRAGITVVFLKLTPHLKWFDTVPSAEFLKKSMGEEAWNVLFQQLFRKKFGKYAEKIVTSFIWARLKKRSKQLVYFKGGFQAFIDHIEDTLEDRGVTILKGNAVVSVAKSGSVFTVSLKNKEKYTFDAVISTLPSPVSIKVAEKLFPVAYKKRMGSISYLNAVNFIIASKEPLFDTTYWSSVCVNEFPMMVFVQHTNFIDPRHYGGQHLLYIANYVEQNHPLMKMNKEETLQHFLPYLEKIRPGFSKKIINLYHFKAPYAQPIYDKEFVQKKPHFVTPIKHLYIANLDMTYPYDRGTNYAVKLGMRVANTCHTAFRKEM